MRISSFFVPFGLLASLASGAIPATLYRGDELTPAQIKSAGGFKAYAPTGGMTPSLTVLRLHVTDHWTYGRDGQDPYISTTSDLGQAQIHAKSKVDGGDDAAYAYVFDSSKITTTIHDVAAEFAAATPLIRYDFSYEKEFSVERTIPWAAVTEIYEYKNEQWQPFTMRSKRAHARDFSRNEVLVA